MQEILFKNGEFQWISLTILISFISIIINIISVLFNNRQQRKNRLTSTVVTTRIENLRLFNQEYLNIINGLIDMNIHLMKDSSKSEDPIGYDKAKLSQETIMRKHLELESLKNPKNIACEQVDICLGISMQRTLKLLKKYNNKEILTEEDKDINKIIEICRLGLKSYNEEEWKWINKNL